MCWPLSWTWAFRCRWILRPCKAFAKNTVNTEKNNIFWLCCWCFWCYVELCLRGIFLVLRWHLNGTFGVWVVSCWWVSWWSWHGMLWALIIWVDNFNGVLHLCAQTQHTSIPNIKQSCTLLAHDISSAFPVLTGEPRYGKGGLRRMW